MGTGFIVECSNCHAPETFHLGIGMMYSALDRVMGIVHWRTRRKIEEFRSGGSVTPKGYEHRLYFCPRCLHVYQRFWVKLEREDGETFETTFKCPKCKSLMRKGDTDFSRYACKVCGRKSLTVVGEILWD